jgi:DNA modification methylase
MLKMPTVPVIICDNWSDNQVRAFRLMVNRSVSWAEWDGELLAAELSDLRDLAFDLSLTGFDAAEIDSLLAPSGTAGLIDDDAVAEPPDDPVCRPGDLWVMGGHRLLCGNSTSITDVRRLMNGDMAHVAFTDPPYNYAYSGRGEVNTLGSIENDDMSDTEFDQFISAVFECCAAAMHELSPIYVCHPDSKTAPKISFERHFARHFHKAATIIWLKQNAGMGWQDYRGQHEPILYGWKIGTGSHYFIGDRSKTTVWDIGRDAQLNYVHPTQKPVALAMEAILNSSKTGQVVLDLFGGSGSTLIAAEKTGRLARLMELDPKYCDVIINRWCDFTGKVARMEACGASFDDIAASRGVSR